MLLSITLAFGAIKGPRPEGKLRHGDYIQALFVLFVFLPVFALSLGQLVPPGESVFLKEWLAGLALNTSIAFIVLASATFIAIYRDLRG